MPQLQAYKGRQQVFPQPQNVPDMVDALRAGNHMLAEGLADEVSLSWESKGFGMTYTEPQELEQVLEILVDTINASRRQRE